jgi:hypothetical protein
MAGYGHDTSTITFIVTLDDETTVVIVGENDGVNGFEWSATHRNHTVPLAVGEVLLVDGMQEADNPLGDPPAELADAWARFQKLGADGVTATEDRKLNDWRRERAEEAGF